MVVVAVVAMATIGSAVLDGERSTRTAKSVRSDRRSMTRTRRSVLFSPGDRPDMLRKASGSGADVVVFDLEDAVAPSRKDDAREAVADALNRIDRDHDHDRDPGPDSGAGPEVLVRVTPDEWDTDLDAVLAGGPSPDGVMLPKTSAAADVEALARGLDERSEEGEGVEGSDRGHRTPVVALIESARGVLNAPAIADSAPVDAMCFGAEDLAADLGAERSPEGTEVLYARERVVLAAAGAGIDAIDTVFTAISETDRLREGTAFARGLGYDGKMAIHPAQVPVINEAFTPDADRIEWARRVLNARNEADAEERGVFRVDGEMVDAPLIAQAERVVTLARAAEEDRAGSNRTGSDDA